MVEFSNPLETSLVSSEAQFHLNNQRQMAKFYSEQSSIPKTSAHLKGKHTKCILNLFTFRLV